MVENPIRKPPDNTEFRVWAADALSFGASRSASCSEPTNVAVNVSACSVCTKTSAHNGGANARQTQRTTAPVPPQSTNRSGPTLRRHGSRNQRNRTSAVTPTPQSAPATLALSPWARQASTEKP